MHIGQLWQGPRPYLERDHNRFFGRSKEIDTLVEMIRRNRLIVVTAPSGVGKTSLLLAGVVPPLRNMHELELMKRTPSLVGPTLVCRTWSRSADPNPHAVLIDCISRAVAELKEDGPEQETVFFRPDQDDVLRDLLRNEVEGLVDCARRGESEYRDATSFLYDLAEQAKRLTIVLDQFEDALRLSQDGNSTLLQIIARATETEPRIRFVISLRHEYMMQLHDLEVRVGGLANRTYYLRSVPVRVAADIIRKPADIEKVTIEERAIKTLLRWIGAPSAAIEAIDFAQNAERTEDDAPSEREAGTSIGSLNLLRLQALLVDINDTLLQRGDVAVLTDDALRDYASDRDRSQVINDAIENYVSKTVDPSLNSASAAECTETAADHLYARLFSRLAPRLTSGGQPGTPGYKIQAPTGTMIMEVLQPDLYALGVKINEVEARKLLQLAEDPASVNIKFEKPPALGGARYDPTSGPARAKGWSPADTLEFLVREFKDLLVKLVEGNILKRLGTQASEAYELVHDGLGEPIVSWARRFQQTIYDPLSSLSVVSGLTFRWKHEIPTDLTINSVFWQGCFIGEANFTNVEFASCDLRGTVFFRCHFRATRFTDCVLDGAMFLACSFSMEMGDGPCEFKGGLIGSSLFVGCKFGSARFEDTILDGSVFKANEVPGSIDIIGTSLEVAMFHDCFYDSNTSRASSGLIRVSSSDLFCTRIVKRDHARNVRVAVDDKCSVFPGNLLDSFNEPLPCRQSKTREEIDAAITRSKRATVAD